MISLISTISSKDNSYSNSNFLAQAIMGPNGPDENSCPAFGPLSAVKKAIESRNTKFFEQVLNKNAQEMLDAVVGLAKTLAPGGNPADRFRFEQRYKNAKAGINDLSQQIKNIFDHCGGDKAMSQAHDAFKEKVLELQQKYEEASKAMHKFKNQLFLNPKNLQAMIDTSRKMLLTAAAAGLTIVGAVVFQTY